MLTRVWLFGLRKVLEEEEEKERRIPQFGTTRHCRNQCATQSVGCVDVYKSMSFGIYLQSSDLVYILPLRSDQNVLESLEGSVLLMDCQLHATVSMLTYLER